MPVRKVSDNPDCYQWGNQKVYCGKGAKEKAIKQGIAIENTGWREAEDETKKIPIEDIEIGSLILGAQGKWFILTKKEIVGDEVKFEMNPYGTLKEEMKGISNIEGVAKLDSKFVVSSPRKELLKKRFGFGAEEIKYKVGDKVKLVHKIDDDDPTPIGTIFIISNVHEGGCSVQDNEYSDAAWIWEEIEMVEKVGFKIGDKAKVVGPINDDEFEDGEIVTITALKNDERVMATNDEGRTILMAWSELEKYTPPKSFNPRKARLQKRFGFGAEGMMLWKGKSIPISEFDYSKVPNGWTVDEYSEYGDYTNEELVILLDNPSKSPQTVITDIEDYDKRDCPRHKYGMGSHFTKRNNGVRRYIMDGCECIIYDNSTMKSRKKRVSKLRREHSNQNILPVESEITNKVLVVSGIIAGLIGLNKLFGK